MITWCRGRVSSGDEPLLHADDHGLVTGDGVFETLQVVDRRPFALGRHLLRLGRSAAGLGIPADLELIRAAAGQLLASPEAPGGLARLRITLTAGRAPLSSDRGDVEPTLVLAVQPAPAQPPYADVVLVPWVRNERAATAGLKTTSYAENVVALAHAHARGGSEALFANTRGELCEGTGSNVFVAVGERLVTPPLDSGCLAGVTRALLLEWVDTAVEGALQPGDLSAASEAFLASTMRDVQPIRTVDGVPLPAVPGPLTRRAAEAFAARKAADWEP